MRLKPDQLYTYRGLPNHWVATDEEYRPWIFPAQTHGWDLRQPYHGHLAALVEAENINAAGTGWIGAQS